MRHHPLPLGWKLVIAVYLAVLAIGIIGLAREAIAP